MRTELVNELRDEAASYADERGIGEPGKLLLEAAETIACLTAEIKVLRALLELLNSRGGLGLDIHERIEVALARSRISNEN
jgi:hypothetical protein